VTSAWEIVDAAMTESAIARLPMHNLLASGVARPTALTDGFKLAFWVGVGFAVIALAAAFVALKREDLKPQAEPVESPREEAADEQVAA